METVRLVRPAGRKVGTRGAVVIAVIVLAVLALAVYAGVQSLRVAANGTLVVNESCQGFEQPTTAELRVSGDESRFGSLTTWQAYLGAPTMCSAAFAFGDLPQDGQFEIRAGSYAGTFTDPRSNMAVEIYWTMQR